MEHNGLQARPVARKDLVVICGDDKDHLLALLRERAEGFRLSQKNPNIVAMHDDDSAAVSGYGVSMIPSSMDAETMCRSLSMRAMSRLDPDLVVIDEIRTSGEAIAVIRMAESGNQVFTTIHAHSKEKAISLLKEMAKETWEVNPSFFDERVAIDFVGEMPRQSVARRHLSF